MDDDGMDGDGGHDILPLPSTLFEDDPDELELAKEGVNVAWPILDTANTATAVSRVETATGGADASAYTAFQSSLNQETTAHHPVTTSSSAAPPIVPQVPGETLRTALDKGPVQGSARREGEGVKFSPLPGALDGRGQGQGGDSPEMNGTARDQGESSGGGLMLKGLAVRSGLGESRDDVEEGDASQVNVDAPTATATATRPAEPSSTFSSPLSSLPDLPDLPDLPSEIPSPIIRPPTPPSPHPPQLIMSPATVRGSGKGKQTKAQGKQGKASEAKGTKGKKTGAGRGKAESSAQGAAAAAAAAAAKKTKSAKATTGTTNAKATSRPKKRKAEVELDGTDSEDALDGGGDADDVDFEISGLKGTTSVNGNGGSQGKGKANANGREQGGGNTSSQGEGMGIGTAKGEGKGKGKSKSKGKGKGRNTVLLDDDDDDDLDSDSEDGEGEVIHPRPTTTRPNKHKTNTTSSTKKINTDNVIVIRDELESDDSDSSSSLSPEPESDVQVDEREEGKTRTKSRDDGGGGRDGNGGRDSEDDDKLRSIDDVGVDVKPVVGGPKPKRPNKHRKRIDAALGISPSTPQPEKLPSTSTKTKTYTEAQLRVMLVGKTQERQSGVCQRPRYSKWGKCTQCVAKAGGDSCRFRDFRVFPINPITTEITGPGRFESVELTDEPTPLPTDFNVPFTAEMILETEQTVAPILLPLITRELRHVVNNKAIKRGVDSAKHRSVCDFCSSTIFAGYFFCKRCGRDYCLSCERFFSEGVDTIDQSPWHLFEAARPRLLRCNARASVAVPKSPSAGVKRKRDVHSGIGVGIGNGNGSVNANGSVNGNGSDMAEEDAISADGGAARRAASKFAPGWETVSGAMARAAAAPSIGDGKSRQQIAWHFREDLQPVSRFSEVEIKGHWLALAEFGVKGRRGTKGTKRTKGTKGSGSANRTADGNADARGLEEDAGRVGDLNGDVNADVIVDAEAVAGITDADVRGETEDWRYLFGLGEGEEVKSLAEEIEQVRRELEVEVEVEGDRERAREVDEDVEREGVVGGMPSGAAGAAALIDKYKNADEGELKDTDTGEEPARSLPSKPSNPQPSQTHSPPQTQPSQTFNPSHAYTKLTHPTAPLPDDPADLTADSLKFMRVPYDQLDNARFDIMWSKGEPIVVDGVDKRLKEEWTPDALIERFGEEICGITDCERDTAWISSVKHFFEAFKNAGGRSKAILKLKDWPATEDFKITHPGLYNDFSDALPVPDYTRREGAMNLYAHFPPGPTRPDLGPKMYNAFAAKETKGGHGSTRLHMDVADAVNIMLYASPLTDRIDRADRADKVGQKVEVVDMTMDDDDVVEAGVAEVQKKGMGAEKGQEAEKVRVKDIDIDDQAAQTDVQTGQPGKRGEARGEAEEVAESDQGGSKGVNGAGQIESTVVDLTSDTPDLIREGDKVDDGASVKDQTTTTTVISETNDQVASSSTQTPTASEEQVVEENKSTIAGDTPAQADVPNITGVHNPTNTAAPASKISPALTPPPPTEPPRQPGCAVWDIYPAKDADKIRTYLSRKFDSKHAFVDPIHAQLFYLDAAMRRELWEKHNVVGWRVYQYPGQAVFIPAGCAHQVCNLADCIKIAVDFVSPHNVKRCQQLTQDFRNENFVKAWKEDVLQLYNILWFAWTSCRETKQRRRREAAFEAEAKRVEEMNAQSAMNDTSHARSYGRPAISSVRDDPNERTPVRGASTGLVSVPPSAPPSPKRRSSQDQPSAANTTATPGDKDTTTPSNKPRIHTLVNKIMHVALTAPDPRPPPEARQPSAAALGPKSKWGRTNLKYTKPASANEGSGGDSDFKPKASSGTAVMGSKKGFQSRSAGGSGQTEQSSTGSRRSSRAVVSVDDKSGNGERRGMAGMDGVVTPAKHGPKMARLTDSVRDGTLPLSMLYTAMRSEMGEGGMMGMGMGMGVESDEGLGLEGEHEVGMGVEVYVNVIGTAMDDPAPGLIPRRESRSEAQDGGQPAFELRNEALEEEGDEEPHEVSSNDQAKTLELENGTAAPEQSPAMRDLGRADDVEMED